MFTNFQGKKIPEEKAKKNYYPQILLEECKYEQEKIKMENLIDDDF